MQNPQLSAKQHPSTEAKLLKGGRDTGALKTEVQVLRLSSTWLCSSRHSRREPFALMQGWSRPANTHELRKCLAVTCKAKTTTTLVLNNKPTVANPKNTQVDKHKNHSNPNIQPKDKQETEMNVGAEGGHAKGWGRLEEKWEEQHKEEAHRH